jgi:preprotein translocase subunit SecE
MLKFIREVRSELRRVTTPTRREWLTTALMVVIFTTVMSLVFFGVDNLLGFIRQTLVNLAMR